MARKIYEAPNSIISDLCVFVDNKPRRISFYPISQFEGSHTGRGSMYQTDSEEMQDAIESSPLFGRTIKLWRVEKSHDEPITESAEDNTGAEAKDMNHVGADVVSTPNDAKDYLEANFGVEKKKLPNIKSIINAAAKHGIVFDALK